MTPRLEPRDQAGLFLIDSGAQYVDGTTDITRTIAVGEPTALMQRPLHAGAEGPYRHRAGRAFPRAPRGAQLDSFARAPLWEAGPISTMAPATASAPILSVHEGPQRISKLGTTPLEPGMILSNEPGYYKAGAFGIRIENLVLVEAVDDRGGGARRCSASRR